MEYTFNVWGQPQLMRNQIELKTNITMATDTMTTDNMAIHEPTGSVVIPEFDRGMLVQLVMGDHAYARQHPVHSSGKDDDMIPTAALHLTRGNSRIKRRFEEAHQCKTESESSEEEAEVDVCLLEPVNEPRLVTYDMAKSLENMDSVEQYLNSLWKDTVKTKEEHISRTSWTRDQTALFDSAYKILSTYQLAKLAYGNNENEPVLRKLALDKATKRLRKTFGFVQWSSKQMVWLHGILVDGLGSALFLCYLEILQSLKRKVPALLDSCLFLDPVAREKESLAGFPNLGPMLRKTWDPLFGFATDVHVEKFTSPPYMLVIPSGPSVPHQSAKRSRLWTAGLAVFGRPIQINVPAYRSPDGYAVKHYLEQVVHAVRVKITQLKKDAHDRPIILIGWSVGSLLACKVALLDEVSAIVCLGFPCNATGIRDYACMDIFANVKCPVLFFIGTHSLIDSVDKVEHLRHKLKTRTSLMVLEAGDELLRLKKNDKRELGLTQNMVDRLIQDEIYLFLKRVLLKPKLKHLPKDPPRKRPKGLKVGNAVRIPSSLKALNLPLKVLDVHVPATTSLGIPTQDGLLKTGSVSTSIPVSPSRVIISSTLPNVQYKKLNSATSNVQKTGMKRHMKGDKRVVRKSKVKKINNLRQSPANGHMATGVSYIESLGTTTSYQDGRGYGFANKQPAITLQRLPPGSFVISSSSSSLSQMSLLPPVVNFDGAAKNTETYYLHNGKLIPTTVRQTGMNTTFTKLHQQVSVSPMSARTEMDERQTDGHLVPSIESATESPLPSPLTGMAAQLNANDLRYLASLIAKHTGSRPSSPLSATPPSAAPACSTQLPTNSSLSAVPSEHQAVFVKPVYCKPSQSSSIPQSSSDKYKLATNVKEVKEQGPVKHARVPIPKKNQLVDEVDRTDGLPISPAQFYQKSQNISQKTPSTVSSFGRKYAGFDIDRKKMKQTVGKVASPLTLRIPAMQKTVDVMGSIEPRGNSLVNRRTCERADANMHAGSLQRNKLLKSPPPNRQTAPQQAFSSPLSQSMLVAVSEDFQQTIVPLIRHSSSVKSSPFASPEKLDAMTELDGGPVDFSVITADEMATSRSRFHVHSPRGRSASITSEISAPDSPSSAGHEHQNMEMTFAEALNCESHDNLADKHKEDFHKHCEESGSCCMPVEHNYGARKCLPMKRSEMSSVDVNLPGFASDDCDANLYGDAIMKELVNKLMADDYSLATDTEFSDCESSQFDMSQDEDQLKSGDDSDINETMVAVTEE